MPTRNKNAQQAKGVRRKHAKQLLRVQRAYQRVCFWHAQKRRKCKKICRGTCMFTNMRRNTTCTGRNTGRNTTCTKCRETPNETPKVDQDQWATNTQPQIGANKKRHLDGL